MIRMWGLMTLLSLPLTALAHDYKAGDLTIGHPWTRATPNGSDMAAGYLTVTNTGKQGDVLTGATVDGVGHVMLHATRQHDGVAHMEHLDGGIKIAPGSTVTLEPGATHLMWMEMTKPLVAGQMVSGTLQFERAGAVPVQFKVEAAGSKTPAVKGGHDGHHGH